MSDKNSIEITGTMTGEPRHLTTKINGAWSSFSVCVKRPEPSRSVDYLYVTAWDANALQVAESFHAGDRINIRGRLEKQSYVTEDGQKHYRTRIVAEHIARPMPEEEEPMDEEDVREE